MHYHSLYGVPVRVYIAQSLTTFGFYGLKALFILYAMSHLPLSENEAIGFYASFMTLSYATCLLGSSLADQWLGVRRVVLLGSGLCCLGINLIFMADEMSLFLLGLSVMSIGSGFLKPNLLAILGSFFTQTEVAEKDKAYALFYLFMNLGGILTSLLSGIALSLPLFGQFFLLMSFLSVTALCWQRPPFCEEKILSLRQWMICGSSLGGLVILYDIILMYQLFFHAISVAVMLGSFCYFAHLYRKSTEKEGMRNILFCVLFFTILCTLMEQSGSSMMLFINKNVHREVMGYTLSAPTFLALNPLFVILLTPLFHRIQGNFLAKMTTGLILVCSGFGVLSYGSFYYGGSAALSPAWIVFVFLLQTMGELLIVPVGFATVSKCAPHRLRSLMMSFFLLSIAYGHMMAGVMAPYVLHTLDRVHHD